MIFFCLENFIMVWFKKLFLFFLLINYLGKDIVVIDFKCLIDVSKCIEMNEIIKKILFVNISGYIFVYL